MKTQTNSSDFPINWENPTDKELFWKLNRSMYPEIMMPLGFDIIGQFFHGPGLNAGFNEYHVPVNIRSWYVNGYMYETLFPNPQFKPDLASEGKEKLQYAIDNLPELWESKWQKEAKEHMAFLESFELDKASLTELVEHLEEVMNRSKRLFEIHFSYAIPSSVTLDQFEDLCDDLFKDNTERKAYQLLVGSEPYTVRANQQLWKLSQQARNNPAINQIIMNRDEEEILDALKVVPEAQGFMEGFMDYLNKYGNQSEIMNYINLPSWREVPAIPLRNLKLLMVNSEKDLIKEHKQICSQRDEMLIKARSNLDSYPQPVKDQFEKLLKTAQVAIFLFEEHVLFFEVPIVNFGRQISLAIGELMVKEGMINHVDDIFYLKFLEIKNINNTSADSFKSIVEERKRSLEGFRSANPPPTMGIPPKQPPPAHPAIKAVKKVHGAPMQTEESDRLSGHAGSPGIVRGRVKVLESPKEGVKLKPGDILVTRSTTPPWTPLFVNLSAVVTDNGGVLSHSAVVAREMGIPAVVGVGNATAILKDDQIVEVNGTTGEVLYEGITF